MAFMAGVAAVAAGLGWVTFHALRLDRRQQEAQADAALQESIRLSLWRMDSLLTPIIAREAARPYFEYQAFYAADRAYTKMWEDYRPGEVRVASPLLTFRDPFVRLHFQVNADGTVSSPQAPAGNMRDMAENRYVPTAAMIEAERTLERVSGLVGRVGTAMGRHRAMAAGAAGSGAGAGRAPVEPPLLAAPQPQRSLADDFGPAPQRAQVAQSVEEFAARQQAAETARNIQREGGDRYARGAPPPPLPLPSAAPAGAAEPAAPVDAVASAPATRPAERAREASAKEAAPAAAPAGAAADAGAPGADVKKAPAAEDDHGQAARPLRIEGAPTSDLTGGLIGATWLPGKGDAPAAPAAVVQGELLPAWVDDPSSGTVELFLLREVVIGNGTLVQGVWLDWPRLREYLVEQVSGRLPGATLVPVVGEDQAGPGARVEEAGARADGRLARRLAAIPAELHLEPRALEAMRRRLMAEAGAGGIIGAWTPMKTALSLAWVAAAAAVVTIALVLRASMDLAERRGRFVSAVTHELRTPLTTFCLYSQMLADGMVPQESARREYLGTLKREAQRLARIVENVLEYARLGRPARRGGGRPANHRDHVAAADLVERLAGPLRERAEQAGMSLVVEAEGLEGAALDTDVQSVERIVYNLVDNACKYAADAPDGRVYLGVRRGAGCVEIEVSDHGPGVRAEDEARLFDPFYRGSSAADASSPGLGLGLALARGLARQLGGDLRLVRHAGPGAKFLLTLPG
jgi:signal transduction histidine kinase